MDDVFRNEFLEGVLFTAKPATSIEVDDAALKHLADLGSKWIGTLSEAGPLAPKPHIAVDTSLRPAFRVYDDSHSTFLHALGQDTSALVFMSYPS